MQWRQQTFPWDPKTLRNIRRWRAQSRARKKILEYERQYRKAGPASERPAPLPIEKTFDDFVAKFGGIKISDRLPNKAQMPLNADYLFEDQNAIVELKTLQGIYSGPEAYKHVAQAYIDAGRTGSDLMGMLFRGEGIPSEVAALIRRRIRRAIEQRIKKARKQLRQSKTAIGDDKTRCLILLAMDQPPLFGHRAMLLSLATLMGDNFSDQHIDGVVS